MAWTDWMQPEPTHDVHGLMKRKERKSTTVRASIAAIFNPGP